MLRSVGSDETRRVVLISTQAKQLRALTECNEWTDTALTRTTPSTARHDAT